jgi:hypothetical protein
MPTLTTARAIHQLPASASQQGYAVHLRAVVTYFDPGNHLLFVQERTDGVFVQTNGIEKLSLRAGDEVEVTGVTLASFAPDVGAARIEDNRPRGFASPQSREIRKRELGPRGLPLARTRGNCPARRPGNGGHPAYAGLGQGYV